MKPDGPSVPATDQPSALQLRGIAKSFGSIEVLRDVNFSVHASEIVMLVGENGAGKSTLKNILVGIVAPSVGQIALNGTAYDHLTTAGARHLGISAIHQELSLFSNLNVAQNIFMPDLARRGMVLDNRKMEARAAELLGRLGARIRPSSPVNMLSLGEKQLVEVAKAIHHSSSVLILDEPTTSLSITERKRLHEVVRKLKSEGCAIIYITHFFEEVFELGDRAVILRDGAIVRQGPIAQMTPDDLSSAMVGREVSIRSFKLPAVSAKADEVLQVTQLKDSFLRDVSFTLRRGEILGLAGLMGAGRSEVASAIIGVRRSSGDVEVNGKPVRRRTPAKMRDAGVVCVSEDRRNDQAFLTRSTSENITSATLAAFVRKVLPFIAFTSERRAVAGSMSDYKVNPPDGSVSFVSLSGGNQQKAILARWMLADPDVVILDEPTKGVDVNARSHIHETIVDQTRDGRSFLLISSDMPELLAISHRVLVMHKGGIVGEVRQDQFDPARILRMASTGAA